MYALAVGKATVYNANAHPECFIMINLDQPITKQATAIGKQQQNEQIFFYRICSNIGATLI